METPVLHICEWTISLYDDKTRKWNYGTLAIVAEDVVFTPSECGGHENRLVVPFDDIIDVKKSTTGLVFGAVYILTKTNKKIWFSSLSDREDVYRALRHFWQSRLLFQDNAGVVKIAKESQTKLGQKLLGIVNESEKSLSTAAVQLYDQGRQLDNAAVTMLDLHNDLDVAERLVDDIDSWFGRWRLPDQYQTIDPVIVNKTDVPDIFEYEVLLTKLETNRVNRRRVGTLRISKDGLTLLNEKMRTEFHFRWADVSQIRVVTPWELMVLRYQIGKPDLVYSLVSANMVAILRLLDKCAKYKLKYDTPPESVLCTRHRWTSGHAGSHNSESKKNTTCTNTAIANNLTMGVPQLQIHQSQQIVSESEADDISRALSGLKSLALSIEEEESVQNEKLDLLTTTVEKANQRLTSTAKKVKQMI